jgi:hypothetical protein
MPNTCRTCPSHTKQDFEQRRHSFASHMHYNQMRIESACLQLCPIKKRTGRHGEGASHLHLLLARSRRSRARPVLVQVDHEVMYKHNIVIPFKQPVAAPL